MEILQAKALKKVYGSGNNAVHALEGVDLSVQKGEFVAIVGTSGSGKSTLLKLLMRFWDVDGGSIRISGKDIRGINTKNLRDVESYVTQETYLFHDSIANNIAVGKPGATREEIVEAAKKASIHEFILTLPHGYDTEVGELGDTLSGGEKQRIGIARAFLHDAPLLLLDEPTSNLDIRNQYQVLQITRDLCREQNLTAMIVIHDLNLALRFCDRFLLLREGAVYRYGGAEIFDADALRDVYGVTGSIVDVQGQKLVLIDDEEKETRS